MQLSQKTAVFIVALVLTGCVHLPSGPSVMVLPGSNMSFEQFRQDDYWCRQFARGQVGGVSANKAAADSQVGSAVLGTALGAAAGAAIGGGRGAAFGAGTGLLAGSLIGSGSASSSAYAMQRDYDNAYLQCMYSYGHQVPVSGQFSQGNRTPANIPPPPPGAPPPPPRR